MRAWYIREQKHILGTSDYAEVDLFETTDKEHTASTRRKRELATSIAQQKYNDMIARRYFCQLAYTNFGESDWSFPKLKIPHHSHADFCSTDTAGGLDNKKRRYAPRGGVAYRLFLWGFPKGATPPFGTRLCEAKCSVLYALSALP